MMAESGLRLGALSRTHLVCFSVALTFFTIISALTSERRGPSFLKELPKLLEFSSTKGSSLACEAEGLPPPTVTWLLSDGSLVANLTGLRLVLSNGTLLFPSFKAENFRQDVHAAVYKCMASNSAGSIISKNVKVKAVTIQPFDLYVYDSYVIKGNTALFKCHIPNFLADYVSVTSWIRDGAFSIQSEDIDGDGKYTVLPNGDLILRQVELKDAHTTFKCHAKHRLTEEVKTSVTSGKLFVTDPEGNVPCRIQGVQSSIHVERSHTAIVPCIANGRPLPTISWFLKIQTKFLPIKEDKRFKFFHGGLLIENAQIDDAGIYVCQASNAASTERAETLLEVTAPLKVAVKPSRLPAKIGEGISLHCDISGYPLKEIQWLKDGRHITKDDVIFANNNATLTIDRIKYVHKGMYQCFAFGDEISNVQSALQLTLGDAPPTFSRVFKELILNPGESLHLECVASGVPLPEIAWQLDGTSLSSEIIAEVSTEETVTSSLIINKTEVEDGGVYTCTAKNKVKTTQYSNRINIKGKLNSRIRPRLLVVAGKTVFIQCPIYGYPIDNIVWKKGEDVLPVHLWQMVLRNGTLRLQNIERNRDSGIYKCIGSNNKGESAVGIVDIRVIVPPKITPFTVQNNIIKEDSRGRLQCLVSEGDLPLTIRWIKDGKEISTNDEISIRKLDEFSSILTINSAQVKHNGNYSCIVSNAGATVEYSVKLTVNVAPHWIVKPQDYSVVMGKNVTLDCLAEGFPKPVIQWMKARGSSPNDERDPLKTNGHMILLENGTLVIQRVMKKHEGYYFCLASNGIGDGLSKALYLQVHGPAKFNVKSRNETVVISENVKVICEAFGDIPINFTWTINSSVIPTHKNERYNIQYKEGEKKDSAVSELIIYNVSRRDSQILKCEAENSFGIDDSFIGIIVIEPPEAPVIVHAKPLGNGTIELEWKNSYDGNSEITKIVIQYKKVNEPWNSADNMSVMVPENKLYFSGFEPFTDYSLRMIAVNQIGNSGYSNEETLKTDEEAPSGPPQNVDVSSLDKKTLRVTWKPPEKKYWNGIILGYNIGYKITDSKDAYTIERLDSPEDHSEELMYQLRNLQMYTQYSVVIQAFNKRGVGPFADEVQVVTSEDVPSEAPKNVRCSSLSTQTIYVIWDPIPSESVNGILRGYRVSIRQVDSWAGGAIETKTTEVSRLTLQGLEVNTNYSIQVLAFTRVGDGIKSTPIYCKTHEDVPTAPGDIKVLPSSSNSVLVAWKPPLKPNGAVTKYNVYIRPVDDDEEVTHGTRYSKDAVSRPSALDDTNIHTSMNDLTYEIQSLDRNKKYEFWVTAVSVVGEGPRSRVVTQSTISSSIAAQSASFDETVKTPWKRDLSIPCKAVGLPPPLKQWIKEGKSVRINDRFTVSSDGTLFIKSIRKEDGGNYTCNIQNVYGTDEVTYAVVVLVPPPAPVLGVYDKTVSSLELKWQHDIHDLSQIRSYILHYRKEDDAWETIELPANIDSYTLRNLSCGAIYQLFMEATNVVGKGEPSDIVAMSTEGGVLTPPPKEQLIREGVTFLSLHLESWTTNSCPIKHFEAEYRRADENVWTLISSEVKPSQKRLVVPGLVPGTWYHIRVTAHSNNGPALAEYMCATLTQNGGTVPPFNPDQLEEKIIWLSLDWILISSSVVLALILILILVLLVCLRRRRSQKKRHSTAGCNSDAKSDYSQLYRPTLHRTKSGNSQGRLESSIRPSTESAASSPAWTVYTNDNGTSEQISRNSAGAHSMDIKDIQSRPLPPTPQRTSQSKKYLQDGMMIYSHESPGHSRHLDKRMLSSFGKHQ